MGKPLDVSLANLVNLCTVSADGCWLWNYSQRGYGYAQITHPTTKRQDYGHRVVWEMVHGVRLHPEDVVMHSCDTPLCVNPKHLELGTQSENLVQSWERHPQKDLRKLAARVRVTQGKLKKSFEEGRAVGSPLGLQVMNRKG